MQQATAVSFFQLRYKGNIGQSLYLNVLTQITMGQMDKSEPDGVKSQDRPEPQVILCVDNGCIG